MNIRAALVVGANQYSRNNNIAHLRSSVCCRRNPYCGMYAKVHAGSDFTLRTKTGCLLLYEAGHTLPASRRAMGSLPIQ